MFALIALLLLGAPKSHTLPIYSLGIPATPSTKWYSYTNKEAGFYFGEINGSNVAPFQGWTVYNNLILKDYSLKVDRKQLDRSESRVTVFPDGLVRVYASGITKNFTLLDSVNVFSVQVQSQSEALFDFRLLFNSPSPGDFGRTLRPEYEPRRVAHFVLPDSLHFQTPRINLDWNFTHGSDFEILKLEDIKRQDSKASVFAGADDPAGDDRGTTGTYVYPLNQNFRTGIFDITHATVGYDSTDGYFTLQFRNLVNPMWHPEYGYQLTFVAIAIGNGKGGERCVGRNSDYVLPADRGFQRIIYVGGGIEVFNAAGKKLAVYVPVPSDTSNPLGSVAKKQISFSLPVSLIGRPAPDWKVSILAGAQDDHGGGGVGEFRTVGRKAAEWQGGGKEKPGQPNVFDELMLK